MSDREAFLNAIRVNSAIGGTNAPIHLNAIARHIGVDSRWPIGKAMAPTFRCWSICNRRANIWARIIRAGGVPAVMGELSAPGSSMARR
jgi:dihydroxy-acid dehydratase